jgi:hypothetical protein
MIADDHHGRCAGTAALSIPAGGIDSLKETVPLFPLLYQ